MSKLIIEATVDSISTLKDNTLKVVLSTQEMSNTTAASLFAFRNQFCKVFISSNNITQLEEELIDKTEIASGKKNRSQSTILRNVLWRIHEQGNFSEDFDTYYRNEMSKVIEHFKTKLD